MEFDKSRVYTAANADELPIGSRCYFADDLAELKEMVLKNDNNDTDILNKILDENSKARFSDRYDLWFLAYLVELPEENVIKPFETIEEAREAVTAHGGFIKDKRDNVYFFVTAYTVSCEGEPSIYISEEWLSLECIYENFVFADDGSPCGKLKEE